MVRDGAEPGDTVSIAGRPAPAPAPTPRLAPGARISRYELVAPLGAGGMGVVWTAQDPELDRRVAIKLLHRDAMYPDSQERLLREGQAMAKLSHPAVVPVFDVGRDGTQLFIVMELVDGENLRSVLRARRHTWRELVALFVRAGRGLAAAHEAGIVHRDFKPDNVLVGRDGRVRVTDFGLAQLTEGDGGAGAVAVGSSPPESTGSGGASGTPRYMAPEQRRGRTSALSDQFSFCVALWEALYRRAPYDELDGAPPPPDRRAPSAPPGAAGPARLARILARGLAHDPAARWPSMTALLDAIERVPRRRRRLALAGGALAGAALVAVVAITAARRPAAADLCTGFEARLTGIWDAPTRARVAAGLRSTKAPRIDEILPRLRGVFDTRAREWIEARTETCRAAVRGELSPQLAAHRIECLDHRRDELGALTRILAAADRKVADRALALADETGRVAACRRAPPLLPAAAAPGEAATPALEALRARVAAATLLRKSGRITDAIEALAKVTDDATEAGALALAGKAALQLAIAQAGTSPEQAEETLRRTLRLAGQAREDALLAEALLHSIYLTGSVRGRIDEGLAIRPLAEAAIARAGDDPALVYKLHHNVGGLLAHADRQDEAWSELQKALAIQERSPELTVASLLTTLNDLGNLAGERGDFDQARALFERAVTAVEQRDGPDAPLVAYPTHNLGNIAYRQGRHEEALALYRRALALFEEDLPPESPAVATALQNVAMMLTVLGKPDEALPLYLRALERRRAAFGDAHPMVAEALVNLGDLHAEAGRHAEARAQLEQAVAIRRKALGPDHLLLASALSNLGLVQIEAGSPREGLHHATEALAIFERTKRPDHPKVIEPLIVLGRGHLASRAPRAAVAPLERAARLKAAVAPELWAQAAFLLARALWDGSGDRTRAISLAREAHAALVAAGPAGATWARRAAAWLAERT